MKKTYTHLGLYSDLVAATGLCHPLFPLARPGKRTQKLVLDTLAFSHKKETPSAVRIDRRWKKDGLVGEEISWSVGYGPRTKAWLLRPANVKGKLPGVLALHDHGGYKWSGKEKIADGPVKAPPVLKGFRDLCYGGRAWANDLAKKGFAVLIHDTFLWGSRNFPLKTAPAFDREAGKRMSTYWYPKGSGTPRNIADFNSTGFYHETTVAKYCSLLGTSLAGIIAYEDRVATNYLFGRKDICNGQIGCVGLSGGGLRAGLLQGTSHRMKASVVVGMMSSSEGLLDQHVVCHTWMLFPGWGKYGDWADLVACRAPSPLMVQYDRGDSLFSMPGMKAADARLKTHYRSVGKAGNYRGEFYPGPHKFDVPMQKSAFAWLGQQLGGK